jgi:hypothetical protein
MSNDEERSNAIAANSLCCALKAGVSHSDLVIRIYFVIRHSSFVICLSVGEPFVSARRARKPPGR